MLNKFNYTQYAKIYTIKDSHQNFTFHIDRLLF